MSKNLQILKDEILEALRREGMGVFHTEPDLWPADRSIWWDTDRRPEYREFITAAKTAGARMVLFFEQELGEEAIMDAEDALESAGVPPEEYREYSRRIAEMRGYSGFVSRIGIGFSLDGLLYFFELESEWFRELMDLIEELTMSDSPTNGADSDPLGGYYSNN